MSIQGVPATPPAPPTASANRSAGTPPSLRARLTSLVLASLIPTLMGLAILLYFFYDGELSQLKQENILTARALVQAVDTELDRGKVAAIVLATSANIAGGDLAAFHAQARRQLNDTLPFNLPTYSFVLNSRSGQQLINTDRPYGQPLPVTELPEQVRQVFATGKPVLSDIFISSTLSKPTIAIIVPVQSGGKVLYTLEARFVPEHMDRLLAVIPRSAERYVSILDSKGVFVSRVHNHETNTSTGFNASPALIKRMQETREGAVEVTTHDGIAVYAMFSRSPGSDWSVVISIPRRTILIQLLQSIAWLSVLALTLACAGFLWAWYVGKGIRRSVLALASPMDNLQSGGSSAIAAWMATMTFREAGEVARNLLQRQHLVEQRTQELAHENSVRKQAEQLLIKQRAQLLQFVANAPVALAMFDRNMHYLEVSSQWLKEFALEHQDLHGRDHYEIFPDFPPRWKIIHQRGLAGEVVRCEEDSFKGPGGMLLWHRWEVRPWYDEQELVAGILIFFENITGRKQIEERLHMVIDEVPNALLIVNQSGLIDMVNARAESFFGYRPEELLGQPIELLIPTRFRDHHPQLRAGYLAEPMARPMGSGRELYALRKDGTELAVEIGLNPITDGAGMTVLVSIDDITERKRMDELSAAIKAAEAANVIKSAFLASMSHELRTPLNAILGYAQILKDERNLSERQGKGLRTIVDSGQHLLALINDVLDLAKIESGKLELTTDIFDLSYFLKTIRNMIDIKAEGKNLPFVLDLQAGLPPAIQADETRLRQVLFNLLSNAIKFTDLGQITLRVACMPCFGDDARLRFTVQDTGTGISTEQQALLFRPFTQLGEASRQAKGTGLGLAISQQLVHLMGGEIGFESQPGVGSSFWFEIPMVVKPALAESPPRQTISGYAGARKTILIVDDIAGNRDVLSDFLTNLGFKAVAVESGQEGLLQLEQIRPDLLIVDMMMPLMSGQEFMRRVRLTTDGARLAIIAVSASNARDARERYLAAGADTFLSLPLVLDALLQEIGKLLPVTWETTQITTGQDLGAESLELLPRAQLEQLHALALSGDMHDILTWTDELENLARQYRPFAIKLRRLADDYQSKAILALVEQALRKGDEGSSSGEILAEAPDYRR